MESREYTYADVRVRAENTVVSIPVTSEFKPEIPVSIKEKWQKIIDVTAKCMNVPAALIMEISEHQISVLVSSRTLDNPYSVGSSEELRSGLYCETVLGGNSPLYIPDARDNAYWCDNSDVRFGMVSYLGFPVKWPDGEFFGTICVLDSIENPYMQSYAELMVLMQEVVERDLESLLCNDSHVMFMDAAYENLLKLNAAGNRMKEKSDAEKEKINDRILNAVLTGLNIISGRGSDKSGSAAEIDSGMLDMNARLNNIVSLVDVIYKTSDRSAISMSVCVRNIIEIIKNNFQHECSKVSFGVDIPENLKPDPDIAFSCGMIITEALMNSVAYAFNGKFNGEVYVMMRENRPGEYTLHISDNGKGVFPGKRNSGSGLTIIEEIVRHLHGTVHISSDKGTSYYIDFTAGFGCDNQ